MIEEKSNISINGGEYCRVHIRVRSETAMGQTVAVSGSTYQLGYFDKEKVVQLVTSPDSYPVWYTLHPIVLPRHQLVYYKYCIMEAGTMKAFENNNSRQFLPDESDSVIEDTFYSNDLEGSGAGMCICIYACICMCMHVYACMHVTCLHKYEYENVYMHMQIYADMCISM